MVGAKSMQELIMGFQVFVIMISHCIYFAHENIRRNNCQYSNLEANKKRIGWLVGQLMKSFITTRQNYGFCLISTSVMSIGLRSQGCTWSPFFNAFITRGTVDPAALSMLIGQVVGWGQNNFKNDPKMLNSMLISWRKYSTLL